MVQTWFSNSRNMRKIKFRGKDIKTGEWLYVDLRNKESVTEAFIATIHRCNVKINPITVGQFTGLTDKNGKEIYEGDIIGCHNPDIKHLIFYDGKEARFKAALNGDINNEFVGVCGLDDSRWNASKEVIGNIHENPELLNL